MIDWTADLTALVQVVAIDIALAGDNAVVVGMAVAGLPERQKKPAIILGIGGATVMRIALGAVALQLLEIIGLLLAMTQIIIADLSMSLDNVLAVAGAAHGSTWVLATGLLLGVILMGLAANFIARLLERHRWIAWVGLAIVLYVAVSMIWHGGHEVATVIPPDWLHAMDYIMDYIAVAKQHFLNFFPLPHGQGSFRPM